MCCNCCRLVNCGERAELGKHHGKHSRESGSGWQGVVSRAGSTARVCAADGDVRAENRRAQVGARHGGGDSKRPIFRESGGGAAYAFTVGGSLLRRNVAEKAEDGNIPETSVELVEESARGAAAVGSDTICDRRLPREAQEGGAERPPLQPLDREPLPLRALARF